MSDADLRELERRAAQGDREARVAVQRHLQRSGRPVSDAWTGLAIELRLEVDPMARLHLPPDELARLQEDLAAIDPLRLLAHRPSAFLVARPPRGLCLAGYGGGPRQLHRALVCDEPDETPDGRLVVGWGGTLEDGTIRRAWAPSWAWDARAPAGLVALAPSPGGRTAAALTSDGALVLVDAAAGGAPRRTVAAALAGPAPLRALAFAPDRRTLGWVTDAAYLVDSKTTGPGAGAAPRRVELPLVPAAAAFAPDLDRVVATDGERVAAVDLATGKLLWEVQRAASRGETLPVCALAWSPDGGQVAEAAGAALVRDAATGEVATALAHGHETVHVEGEQRSIMGLAMDDAEPSYSHERPACATRVAFAGAFVATLGTTRELWLWEGGRRVLRVPAVERGPLVASPDGRLLLYREANDVESPHRPRMPPDGELALLDLRSPTEHPSGRRQVPAPGMIATSAAWMRGGARLAFGGDDGRVHVFETEDLV